MTLEEIKKTGDKKAILEELKKTGDRKAILKYRTQCAKDSIKEYREQSIMDKQQKQVIERLENIVYLYNRESRGWHDCNDIRLNSNDIKAIEKAIELIRTIQLAKPYKGMTNGEALKIVFPHEDVYKGEFGYDLGGCTIDYDWWNAPYKEEQERSDKE